VLISLPERRESNSHNKRLPLSTRIMTNKILFCTNANFIPFHFQNPRFYQRPRYSGALIFKLIFDLNMFIDCFIISFLNCGNFNCDIEKINNRNKRLIKYYQIMYKPLQIIIFFEMNELLYL